MLKQPYSNFYEKSLRRSADINMSLKYYNEAKDQFNELETKAEYPENILAAQIGQMRASYELEQYDITIEMCKYLLGTDKITQELVEECHLKMAKSALATDDFPTAMREFQFTTDNFKTEMGAEAQYNVAYIQFLQKDLDSAEASVIKLVNQVPSYDYWISKGLLLLAEVYLEKDDAFQTKHILQSVIDNTKDTDLVKLAEDQLKEIEDKEAKDRAVVKDDDVIDVIMEGGDIELYEEEEEVEEDITELPKEEDEKEDEE